MMKISSVRAGIVNRFTSTVDRILINKYSTKIPTKVLSTIFDVLFFSSLKQDELRNISCQLIYVDPHNADPIPPSVIRRHRWNYVSLRRPLLLTVASLRRIALATDFRSSSIVVYPDKGRQVKIWGFIDQLVDGAAFIERDSDSGSPLPGVFQTSIKGCGHILVRNHYRKIAELRGHEIVTESIPILEEEGPVLGKLTGNKLSKDGARRRGNRRSVRNLNPASFGSLESLTRILFRIQRFGHGGAVLITDTPVSSALKINYRIRYDRLSRALAYLDDVRSLSSEVFSALLSLNRKRSDREQSRIISLQWGLHQLDAELRDCKAEIAGCIWFIALLSRIDGAVLLNKKLEVLGFGVEIMTNDLPNKIVKSNSTEPTSPHIKAISYADYGTRHRSMMRYCMQDSSAVGFVVSQDRDIRVITRVNESIVLWENIQLGLDRFLQKYDSSPGYFRKEKRKRFAKSFKRGESYLSSRLRERLSNLLVPAKVSTP